MKRALLLYCFCSTTIFGSGQTDVAQFAEAIRTSNLSAGAIKLLDENRSRHVLSAVSLLKMDSSPSVRFNAYAFLSHFKNKRIAPGLRARAVATLIAGWRDDDPGIVSLVGDILTGFDKSDFSQAARDSLAILLSIVPPQYKTLVKLCGYLEMKDQRQLLRSQLQSGRLSKRDSWSARIALCRLGDSNMIDEVLSKVRSQPITIEAIDLIYPELVYTRQPKAIEFLVEQVLTNSAKCDAPNPELRDTLPCAIHIIRLLAPALSEFPIALDNNGDFATNDYSAIVSRVQDWLRQGKYKIRTDNF
jgi:hypothetical protein